MLREDIKINSLMLSNDGELKHVSFFSLSDSRNYIMSAGGFIAVFGWTAKELIEMVGLTPHQQALIAMHNRTMGLELELELLLKSIVEDAI